MTTKPCEWGHTERPCAHDDMDAEWLAFLDSED